MPYILTGLDPAPFIPLFGAGESALDARRVQRMIADSNVGFPCRVTLADAPKGSQLLLLNHLSRTDDGPYQATRSSCARMRERRRSTKRRFRR